MFENLFKNVIFKILGDIVEDFAANEINANSWNGQFKKQFLRIKRESLEYIYNNIGSTFITLPILNILYISGLNLKLKAGYIGNLFVKIPWTKIWKEPCDVLIDDIHIFCTISNDYDLKNLKKFHLNQKFSKLKDIENQEKKLLGVQKNEDSTRMKEFLKIIIENINISIKNIHFRIEDDNVLSSTKSFAFGITLGSFTYEPTNSQFQRAFIDKQAKKKEKFSYTLCALKDICCYIERNQQEMWLKNNNWSFDDNDPIKFIEFSSKYIANNSAKLKKNHNFILYPTTIILQKITSLSEENSPNTPNHALNIFVDNFTLSIEDQKYKFLLYIADLIKWNSQVAYHLKNRPGYSIRPDGRNNIEIWWKYAIDSVILRNQIKRNNFLWPNILKHRKMAKEYITLYKFKFLLMLGESDLNKRNKFINSNQVLEVEKNGETVRLDFETLLEALTEYEELFHLEEILVYRSRAKLEISNVNDMNEFIKSKVKEKVKDLPEKKSVLKRVIWGIGSFGIFSRKANQNAIITEETLQNMKEFIDDNKIYDNRPSHHSGEDRLQLSIFWDCKKMKIKLKNRPTETNCFTFFYVRLDNFKGLFLKHKITRDLSFSIDFFDVRDKITLNKKCMMLFSPKIPKISTHIVSLSSRENYSGRPFTECQLVFSKKKIHNEIDKSNQIYQHKDIIKIAIKIGAFDLVWNKDLNLRLNFFLKNPVITRVANEENDEITTEKLENILKEKLHNMFLYNYQFEFDIELMGYQILLPENPNSEQSAFMVFSMQNLSLKSLEQDSPYKTESQNGESETNTEQKTNDDTSDPSQTQEKFELKCSGIGLRYVEGSENMILTSEKDSYCDWKFIFFENAHLNLNLCKSMVIAENEVSIIIKSKAFLSQIDLNVPLLLTTKFKNMIRLIKNLLSAKNFQFEPTFQFPKKAPVQQIVMRKVLPINKLENNLENPKLFPESGRVSINSTGPMQHTSKTHNNEMIDDQDPDEFFDAVDDLSQILESKKYTSNVQPTQENYAILPLMNQYEEVDQVGTSNGLADCLNIQFDLDLPGIQIHIVENQNTLLKQKAYIHIANSRLSMEATAKKIEVTLSFSKFLLNFEAFTGVKTAFEISSSEKLVDSMLEEPIQVKYCMIQESPTTIEIDTYMPQIKVVLDPELPDAVLDLKNRLKENFLESMISTDNLVSPRKKLIPMENTVPMIKNFKIKIDTFQLFLKGMKEDQVILTQKNLHFNANFKEDESIMIEGKIESINLTMLFENMRKKNNHCVLLLDSNLKIKPFGIQFLAKKNKLTDVEPINFEYIFTLDLSQIYIEINLPRYAIMYNICRHYFEKVRRSTTTFSAASFEELETPRSGKLSPSLAEISFNIEIILDEFKLKLPFKIEESSTLDPNMISYGTGQEASLQLNMEKNRIISSSKTEKSHLEGILYFTLGIGHKEKILLEKFYYTVGSCFAKKDQQKLQLVNLIENITFKIDDLQLNLSFDDCFVLSNCMTYYQKKLMKFQTLTRKAMKKPRSNMMINALNEQPSLNSGAMIVLEDDMNISDLSEILSIKLNVMTLKLNFYFDLEDFYRIRDKEKEVVYQEFNKYNNYLAFKATSITSQYDLTNNTNSSMKLKDWKLAIGEIDFCYVEKKDKHEINSIIKCILMKEKLDNDELDSKQIIISQKDSMACSYDQSILSISYDPQVLGLSITMRKIRLFLTPNIIKLGIFAQKALIGKNDDNIKEKKKAGKISFKIIGDNISVCVHHNSVQKSIKADIEQRRTILLLTLGKININFDQNLQNGNLMCNIDDFSLSLTNKKQTSIFKIFKESYILYPTKFELILKLRNNRLNVLEMKALEEICVDLESGFIGFMLHFDNILRKLFKKVNSVFPKVFKDQDKKSNEELIVEDSFNSGELISIEVGNLYCTLLSTTLKSLKNNKSQPLFNIEITYFKFNSSNLIKMLSNLHSSFPCNLSSIMSLKVYYLNQKKQAYEPCVETLTLKLDSSMDQAHLNLAIDFMNQTLINFTPEALDKSIKLLNELDFSNLINASYPDNSNVAYMLSPNFFQMPNKRYSHYIQNLTGLNLVLIVSDKKQYNIKHSEEVMINLYGNNGQEREAAKNTENKENLNDLYGYHGKNNQKRKLICISPETEDVLVEIEGLKQKLKFSFKDEGLFYFQVDKHKSMNFFCEIIFSIEEGHKIISFKSNTIVKNNLSFPITIKLKVHENHDGEAFMKQGKDELTIQPQNQIQLPFNLQNYVHIKIKPDSSTLENYEWSPTLALIPDDGVKDMVFIHSCQKKKVKPTGIDSMNIRDDDNDRCFIINHFTMEKIQCKNSGNQMIAQYIINLNFPIIIENLLPLPVSIRLKNVVNSHSKNNNNNNNNKINQELTHLDAQNNRNVINDNEEVNDDTNNSSTNIPTIDNYYYTKLYYDIGSSQSLTTAAVTTTSSSHNLINDKISKTILTSNEEYIYNINTFKEFQLSLKLDNYMWTNYIRIIDKDLQDDLISYGQQLFIFNLQRKFFDKITKRYYYNRLYQLLQANTYNQLNVNIETKYENGSFYIIIYSQYWFLNETSFPINVKLKEDNYTYDIMSLIPSNKKIIDNIQPTSSSANINNASIIANPSRNSNNSSSEENKSYNEYMINDSNTLNTLTKAKLLYSSGLASINPNCTIEEKYISIKNIEKDFLSLRANQFSKNILDALISQKSPYIKIITTNANNETKKSISVCLEKITNWSYEFDLDNFDGTEPYLQLNEKILDENQGHNQITGMNIMNSIINNPSNIVNLGSTILNNSSNNSGSGGSNTNNVGSVSMNFSKNFFKSQKKEKIPRCIYEICLNTVELPGKFNRTKMLIFSPKYIFLNDTKFFLYISQTTNNKDMLGTIAANTAISLYWNDTDKKRSLFLKINSIDSPWSSEIPVDKQMNFPLRIKGQKDNENIENIIFSIDISKNSSIFVITIKLLENNPPYIIENDTKYTLRISQLPNEISSDIIKPYKKIPYAWEEIIKNHEISVKIMENTAELIDLGKLDITQKNQISRDTKGIILNFPINIRRADNFICVDIVENQKVKVIRFHHGIKNIEVDTNPIRQITLTLKLNHLGISLIDENKIRGILQEILFISFQGLSIYFWTDREKYKLKFRIVDYQIDNKLIKSDMPVLLSRKVDNINRKGENLVNKIVHIVKYEIKDIFNTSKQQNNIDYFLKFHINFETGFSSYTTKAITLFKFYLKPIEINLDGILIDILVSLSLNILRILSSQIMLQKNPKKDNFSLDQNNLEINNNNDMIQSTMTDQENVISVESLVISDLNISINFKNFHVLINKLSNIYALRLLGMLFSSFGSYSLFFETFYMNEARLPLESLFNETLKFYSIKLNQQLYWLIANAEIIGNPRLFISQICNLDINLFTINNAKLQKASAFREFFSEITNKVSLNPILFTYGIAKGAQSLCRSVISSCLESGSMILNNLQHGIFLSFVDKKPDKNNNNKIFANDPRSRSNSPPVERSGGENNITSVDSILNGVTNLIHATLLFPFAQPATPYLINKRKDLNSTKPLNITSTQPKRHLRYISPSGILTPYDEVLAMTQNNLIKQSGEPPFNLDQPIQAKSHMIFIADIGFGMHNNKTNENALYIYDKVQEIQINSDKESLKLKIKKDLSAIHAKALKQRKNLKAKMMLEDIDLIYVVFENNNQMTHFVECLRLRIHKLNIVNLQFLFYFFL